MTGAARYPGTIPALLTAAADRDPGGIWLRADAGTLSFTGAAAAAGVTAAALRDAGIGHGDLVVVTARTNPPYLLCWLALASIGAVTVPVNPRSAPAELAGLVAQTRPRPLITDAGLSELAAASTSAAAAPELGVPDVGSLVPGWRAPSRAAVGAPVSVPVVGPASGSARLPDASTSLPFFHINAPAYGHGLTGLRSRPGAAAAFSAGGFLDAARRHGATEFNAIGAMLEILMRQPPRPDDADTPLRLCYTGPAPEGGRQEEIEARFGLRIVVGYAMSESPYGLIWARGDRPFGTLGSVRQHPTLGTINEARVVAHRCGPGSRRDRRAAAAQPGRHPRLLGDARGDSCHDRRWLAAYRRSGHRRHRRYLHVRRPEEGGAAAAGREPVAAGGRGGA